MSGSRGPYGAQLLPSKQGEASDSPQYVRTGWRPLPPRKWGVHWGHMLQKNTMWTRVLMVAGFGAAGAVSRYLVGLTALKLIPTAPFVATLVVNLVGCFAFGVVSQLGDGVSWLTPQLRTAILTGFLGAFTTFSAFSFDTIALAESRGLTWAAAYVVAQNVVGIALAFGGMLWARSAA